LVGALDGKRRKIPLFPGAYYRCVYRRIRRKMPDAKQERNMAFVALQKTGSSDRVTL
jgi:hypothetical protein